MFQPNGKMTVAFAGRRITVEQHPVSNGETSYTYEMVRVKNAVAILPIFHVVRGGEAADDCLLLRHYRFPTSKPGVAPRAIIEACAGVVEQDEEKPEPEGGFGVGAKRGPCLSAAKRELKEETGYSGGSWYYFGTCYTSPGITNEAIHMYVVEDPRPGKQELEASEKGELETYRLPLGEAINLVQTGHVTDMKTATILMHYAITGLSWGRINEAPSRLFELVSSTPKDLVEEDGADPALG